jgi:arginyl-tRNA synthetase
VTTANLSTPAELSTAIRDALVASVRAGELTLDESALPADVHVERPRNKDHGDYATNVALQLAKKAGQQPRAVAEGLAERLRATDGISAVDVAGPGFLNITLDAGAQGELARSIVTTGKEYGRSDTLRGTKVNLEFVSANPTGPLHLGHTRWAAVGDALGRVLSAAGADVTREFYVNDAGVQMDKFGASLMAVANGEPVPEDGYHGAYVPELAQRVVERVPGILELDRDAQLVAFRDEGYALQLDEHRRVLDAFGTHFDVWFSERTLHEGGRVTKAMDTLREQGHVFDADGAVWLRTTDFKDDKDRVLVKANGELTYFAADAAYYLDKRERGFDVCVYMLGADHHGYVGRLRAIAACAGDDPAKNIDVLIGQLVNLLRDGEPVRLSKRAGNIITLEDLVEWVGVDAARYSLTRSNTDSALTLDVDVLTARTNDNPVFYVQYAHARISSLLRNAADLGIDLSDAAAFDPALLDHEREGLLLGALGDFPRVVATAAELREPHRVARYLEELAGTYHRFYDACRVLPQGDEDPGPLNVARLWLCAATRTVLANGLDLLGVTAPERM